MKTFRNGNPGVFVPKQVELYDSRLDTLARVEIHDTGILIRTTRANITPGAQAAFVHYLATEGFIPEHYRSYSSHSTVAEPLVRWITDSSWVGLKQRGKLAGLRLGAFLTWGRILALGLFIIAFTLALWLKPR